MAEEMRTAYHEQLSDLNDRLGTMCDLAGTAMERATRALLESDLAGTEEVIGDHEKVVAMSVDAAGRAIKLLALQQPVAGDLRNIVGSIQIVADIERMDALAVHVAKIARRRHPEPAVSEEISTYFNQMGQVACQMATIAREVLRTRDPQKAAGIREQDVVMNDLHRQLFGVLLDGGEWTHGVQAAVDAALLGRFYERFADHAVEIGRRVVFQATGALPAEQDVGTY